MPPWVKKFKRYNPPEVHVRNVYELENKYNNNVVFVVAPGPSFDKFPTKELDNFVTIGVNSVLEIYVPTYWIFQEGIFCKRYLNLYTKGSVQNIVTRFCRADFIKQFIPAPKNLYGYESQDISVLKMKRDPTIKPYWKIPDKGFLPGKCSVAANGISLSVLMQPKLVVLIGIDLRLEGDKYYANGIKINQGPRLKVKALSASRAWMSLAAQRRVWSSTRVITTSPWLNLRHIERVDVDTALKMSYKIKEEQNGKVDCQ